MKIVFLFAMMIANRSDRIGRDDVECQERLISSPFHSFSFPWFFHQSYQPLILGKEIEGLKNAQPSVPPTFQPSNLNLLSSYLLRQRLVLGHDGGRKASSFSSTVASFITSCHVHLMLTPQSGTPLAVIYRWSWNGQIQAEFRGLGSGTSFK